MVFGVSLTGGIWTGTPFVRTRVQHLRLKGKFPDWKHARTRPYNDLLSFLRCINNNPLVATWCVIGSGTVLIGEAVDNNSAAIRRQ